MLNLKAAGATQLTMEGGGLSDWSVTLEGEELYTLPRTFTVNDTFKVRRIIENMMQTAFDEGSLGMAILKDKEIEQILETGNTQLNALRDENERLAIALRNHMIKNQPDY